VVISSIQELLSLVTPPLEGVKMNPLGFEAVLGFLNPFYCPKTPHQEKCGDGGVPQYVLHEEPLCGFKITRAQPRSFY
jgi:hypothetical protein